MIEIYGGDSPNVIKLLLAMQELGLDYERRPLDIMKGEQFEPSYIEINPNSKIPAMLDHAPADDGPPVPLFESGAMLIYVAEKAGGLLPTEIRQRSEVIAWVMWQMAGQGPMLGQAGHFRNFAPEKLPYAIKRYTDEAARLYRVLNARLEGREFLVGDLSIADHACFPWTLFNQHHGVDLADYPHVRRWHNALRARPSFERALPDYEPFAPPVLDDEARRNLFNLK